MRESAEDQDDPTFRTLSAKNVPHIQRDDIVWRKQLPKRTDPRTHPRLRAMEKAERLNGEGSFVGAGSMTSNTRRISRLNLATARRLSVFAAYAICSGGDGDGVLSSSSVAGVVRATS